MTEPQEYYIIVYTYIFSIEEKRRKIGLGGKNAIHKVF